MNVFHAGDIKGVKVDIDAEPGVAGRSRIQGIRTVALLRDGRPAASVGAKARRVMEASLGLATPASAITTSARNPT